MLANICSNNYDDVVYIHNSRYIIIYVQIHLTCPEFSSTVNGFCRIYKDQKGENTILQYPAGVEELFKVT